MQLEDIVRLDIAKLHNEINILVNMRMVIALGCLSAIIFAMLSWSKIGPSANFEEILRQSTYVSCPWIVVLGFQYMSYYIWIKIRHYAAYLNVKGWSRWEADCYSFRHFKSKIISERMLHYTLVKSDGTGFCCIFYLATCLMCFQLALVFPACKKSILFGYNNCVSYYLWAPAILNGLIIACSVVLHIRFYLINKKWEDNVIKLWRKALK